MHRETLIDEKKNKDYVSVALATIVQLIAVPDFSLPACLSALIHSGVVKMDLLVVIRITAAYVYSLVTFGFRIANQPLGTSEFFETSALLIAAFARIRAVAAVSFRSLQTTTATIIEDGADLEIDIRLLQYGDIFKVSPHTTIPTDGNVINGSSEVDESMITGESIPVTKGKGDDVSAGTVNGSGTVTVKLARLLGKNTVTDIVTDIAKMVEEAKNSKPRLQDIADRVASWFVPVVASIAVVVVIVWLAVGFKVRN